MDRARQGRTSHYPRGAAYAAVGSLSENTERMECDTEAVRALGPDAPPKGGNRAWVPGRGRKGKDPERPYSSMASTDVVPSVTIWKRIKRYETA